MKDKTQKELIQELHQGIYGVPDSLEHGLIGDVKELVTAVRAQNSRLGKNEQKVSKIVGVLIGLGIVGGTGLGLGIKTLLGG